MEPSLKLKEEGNQYFLQKNFVAALDKYSQAINLNDTNATFFFNRAKCYKELKEF
jgi:tetratricopeptide (TPR) repeat protein